MPYFDFLKNYQKIFISMLFGLRNPNISSVFFRYFLFSFFTLFFGCMKRILDIFKKFWEKTDLTFGFPGPVNTKKNLYEKCFDKSSGSQNFNFQIKIWNRNLAKIGGKIFISVKLMQIFYSKSWWIYQMYAPLLIS